jgi:phosphoribosylamine-glycine ligase
LLEIAMSDNEQGNAAGPKVVEFTIRYVVPGDVPGIDMVQLAKDNIDSLVYNMTHNETGQFIGQWVNQHITVKPAEENEPISPEVAEWIVTFWRRQEAAAMRERMFPTKCPDCGLPLMPHGHVCPNKGNEGK